MLRQNVLLNLTLLNDDKGKRGRRLGAVRALGHHGELAVGLEDGKGDLVHAGIAGASQALQQIVYAQVLVAHLVKVDALRRDDNGRRARDQVAQRLALAVDKAEDLMQNEQREDAHDPIDERNRQVGHGDCGQVGDDQGDHQLEGLHLSDLALAHQPHDDQQQHKDDDTSEKDNIHSTLSLRRRRTIYAEYPGQPAHKLE